MEFPQPDDLIYLNHAGVAPWPRRTCEAVKAFAEENMRQGARFYPRWLETEARLRGALAELIGAPSPDDIALVKNTSEALSMVAHGLDWTAGDNVVTAACEFPSNRIVWESLTPFGVEVREAVLGERPEEALMAQVDERTRLLSISAIQYADGLRMDLQRLGAFCRERGVLFCVDAIQAVGAVAFDVRAIQADFAMADGHKWMLAPEGLGFFYSTPEARERLVLRQYGWHMVEEAGDFERRDWRVAKSARRFECGSPNMLGIHALDASLSLLLEVGMEAVEKAVLERARALMEGVARRPLRLVTPAEEGRHGGIVTFAPLEGDPQDLYSFLTASGVVCALRGGGVRFSPHFYTPWEKIGRALALVDSFLS